MKARQEEIKKFIQARGEVSLRELSAHFSPWSEMTIRRDLELLEKLHLIIRTKGGARVLPASYWVTEDVYGEREHRNYLEKQEIGRKAAQLIEASSGIFIDAGSTAMALAQQVPDISTAVITCAPNAALEILLKKQNPRVILLGGTLSRKTVSTASINTLEQLKNLNIDTAFMSTSGFTENDGFSVGDQRECELKSMIMGKARRVVMLFDSSKYGTLMPFTFARMKDVDVLVCDRNMPDELRKVFTDNGVKVI